MASLKEMRNRIASVKATQKITKAMQMVAAAKLRRSQDAAEAARPSPRGWLSNVIANLAAGVSGDGAPALLAGTGRDDRHLVDRRRRRPRPGRRLHLVDRPRRARADRRA